jgi:hypothetical protein
MTRKTPPALPPLLWGEDGRVCCPQHAPFPGSDTWTRDRWRRMRDHEVAAFAAQIGRPVECETCRAIRLRGAEAGR